MLNKGYYTTKGGHKARLDNDITEHGLGVVSGVGYVCYNANGEFSYKDENYDPHPGDSLDLIVSEWQPFVSKYEIEFEENRHGSSIAPEHSKSIS